MVPFFVPVLSCPVVVLPRPALTGLYAMSAFSVYHSAVQESTAEPSLKSLQSTLAEVFSRHRPFRHRLVPPPADVLITGNPVESSRQALATPPYLGDTFPVDVNVVGL